MEGSGSTGQYTPHAFDLRLLGTEQAADHIVYLHEVHHAALNDVTAWGTALHVYARLPGGGPLFTTLLDASRTVHESLATFASVEIATARHGALDQVLAAYPRYVPLYEATKRLTALVEGPNRRQQIAMALARLCMQTPVLDAIAEDGVDDFQLAALRELDRPDARWAWFLRRGPGPVAAAARAADQAVIGEYGPAVLDTDGPASDLYTATDRSHDAAWDSWEAAAYEHLRMAIADAGVGTLPLTGHQDGTARLLELLDAEYGDLGLRAEMSDTQRRDDAELAASVLQQVRHDLAGGQRYRALLLPPMDVGELVHLLADCPVAGGRPAMIVDARPADRLTALYRWPPSSERPSVAVRLMVDADDEPAVGHIPLADPAQLSRLVEAWGDRGEFLVCAGASCLAEPEFASKWLNGAPRPIFMLVDIEPARFVPRWAAEGRTVVAVPLQVNDTGGRRSALLFTADAGQVWWLTVADDVTVRLMIEYLRGHLGAAIRVDPDALGEIREAAIVVITHVLATESFTSFDALGSPSAR
jgi:hypothetical protein